MCDKELTDPDHEAQGESCGDMTGNTKISEENIIEIYIAINKFKINTNM